MLEKRRPILSICIPTNGVDEVFSVLDSVFSQNVDKVLYEVIVTDNGDNEAFARKMGEYCELASNLIYKRTDAKLFLNQVEAFRLVRAPFAKFINHRTALLPGSLARLISFVEKNEHNRPITYFSNGALSINNTIKCSDFDSFVRSLSYQSSWSGGLAFWKSDFDAWAQSHQGGGLFPHCDILFYVREGREYCIIDEPCFYGLNSSHEHKGSYNLFRAFAIEYPAIILGLFCDGDISLETFMKVLDDNLTFIAGLYLNFIVLHRQCSYDLSGFRDSIRVFYSLHSVIFRTAKRIITQLFARKNGR